ISLSHEVMPAAPEFERTSTTLVNAYVGPKIERYLSRLDERLREAGFRGELLIMQSNGGVMPGGYVPQKAVAGMGAGPAGGGGRGHGGDGGGQRGRRARLHLRRHGRHELRRVPGARRPAGGAIGVELAPPLPGGAADGRRRDGRRWRGLDRARGVRSVARG